MKDKATGNGPQAAGNGPQAAGSRQQAAGVDFGPDADVVPRADADFDAWMDTIAPAVNAPKAAPRREMWDAIQAAQRTARDAGAGALAGVTPLRRQWPLMAAVAAALVLGIAIDRFALRAPAAPTTAGSTAPVADSINPARLYRLAAAQTLTQAEALLTSYRANGVAMRDSATTRQLVRWGRQVLSSTRLLIDSPAGSDPQLRSLLDDLELVLVQIIQVSGAPLDPGERALIERALEERDLLPRLRNAVPAGNGAANTAD